MAAADECESREPLAPPSASKSDAAPEVSIEDEAHPHHPSRIHARCSFVALAWTLAFLCTGLLCPLVLGINIGLLYSLQWHGVDSSGGPAVQGGSLAAGTVYTSDEPAPLPHDCYVPNKLMGGILNRLVDAALELEMPLDPSAYQNQYSAGPLLVHTYNMTIADFEVGAVEIAACYKPDSSWWALMPNSLLVRLYEAECEGTIIYELLARPFGGMVGGGVASARGDGFLELHMDLDSMVNGTVTSCGGVLKMQSLNLTGMRMSDPNSLFSDLAETVCEGSGLSSYVGPSRPKASGLVDTFNYEVKAALPELHDAATFAFDRVLFVLLWLLLLLLLLPCILCGQDFKEKIPGEEHISCGLRYACCCYINLFGIVLLSFIALLFLLFVIDKTDV